MIIPIIAPSLTGKTHYVNRLDSESSAVVFDSDELMSDARLLRILREANDWVTHNAERARQIRTSLARYPHARVLLVHSAYWATLLCPSVEPLAVILDRDEFERRCQANLGKAQNARLGRADVLRWWHLRSTHLWSQLCSTGSHKRPDLTPPFHDLAGAVSKAVAVSHTLSPRSPIL